MRTERLGNLIELRNGFAFKSGQFNTAGHGLPIARIRDVKRGYSATFFDGDYDTRYLISDGDVLIGMDGEFNLATWHGGPSLLNQRVCTVATNDERLHQRYLVRFLPAALMRIEDATPFVTVKHLSAKQIRDINIPLPPLPEQRRIAAILDKADALRQERREAIAKLDQLLQSVFLEMFGDPAKNPNTWHIVNLGQVVSIDAPLIDPRSDAYEQLLHYGPDRISSDTGRLAVAKTAAEDGLISKKFLCDERHILYSKIRPYLNKVALAEEKCLCSADVYPVEPIVDSTERVFIWTLLRSEHFLEYAASFSNRANIPKLNRKQLLSYGFPLPPIALQRRYVAVFREYKQVANRHARSAAHLETLFGSLQQRAFTGQL